MKAKKSNKVVYRESKEVRKVRPHCKYCGGTGSKGEKAKYVWVGKQKFRVPVSHVFCAEAVSHQLFPL